MNNFPAFALLNKIVILVDMDLLKLLKAKASYFNSPDDQGVMSVVTHIEIAEKHYETGLKGDDYLFNDTIYRCNQAFEGALKEAYRIYRADEFSQKKSTYDIEKYFMDERLLKDRVLASFNNYRTEWRNKSTHDYKLFFNAQEALLAIVNISAFINILFDQMIQKKSFDLETLALNSVSKKQIKTYSQSLRDQIKDLLILFSKTSGSQFFEENNPYVREAEILGALDAFLSRTAPGLKIEIEKKLKNKFRVDMQISNANETVILELKTSQQASRRLVEQGLEQLTSYLRQAEIKEGILFIMPNRDSELQIQETNKSFGDNSFSLTRISSAISDKEV